ALDYAVRDPVALGESRDTHATPVVVILRLATAGSPRPRRPAGPSPRPGSRRTPGGLAAAAAGPSTDPAPPRRSAVAHALPGWSARRPRADDGADARCRSARRCEDR